MPDVSATKTSRWAGAGFNLLIACVLHAVMAFGAYGASFLEGCDRSDGIVGATFLALVVDIVVTCVVVLMVIRRHPASWRSVLLGWAISYIVVILLVTAAVGYANSIETGCPA